MKNRSTLLERAEQNLAEARAARASAKAASLIARIDTPDAGIRPIGPSRIVIALCGVLGGLLVGFGIVFLSVPSEFGGQKLNGHANGHGAAFPASANGHLSLRMALRKLSE